MQTQRQWKGRISTTNHLINGNYDAHTNASQPCIKQKAPHSLTCLTNMVIGYNPELSRRSSVKFHSQTSGNTARQAQHTPPPCLLTVVLGNPNTFSFFTKSVPVALYSSGLRAEAPRIYHFRWSLTAWISLASPSKQRCCIVP